MTKTIQIAPYDHEIKVEGLSQYRIEDVKKCFSAAIAMASKRWQLEMMLNECFKLNGKIE